MGTASKCEEGAGGNKHMKTHNESICDQFKVRKRGHSEDLGGRGRKPKANKFKKYLLTHYELVRSQSPSRSR